MPRALIVDDREESLYYLEFLLAGNGYAPELARNGAEALAKARQSVPDIVISDLLMPVMDGFSLLRAWKADDQLKHVPFVVCTATYRDPEDEQLARKLGADGFILKPVEPDDLLAKLREVEAQTAVSPLPPESPERDEIAVLKLYNVAIIRKLEQKTLQLDAANRALQNDISARERIEAALRDSEHRFRGTFEQAAVGIAHVSREGRFLRANARLCEITGYSREDLMGLTVESLTVPEDRAESQEARLAMLSGSQARFTIEKRFLRNGGGLVWVNLFTTLEHSPSGEEPFFISVFVDITKRKNAEGALQRAFDELELRVAERTSELAAANESLRVENIERQMAMDTLRLLASSLEKAREEADAGNRAKSDFLSRMSHELRTPLNAILGYGQILEQSAGLPQIQDEVGAILEAGRHLLALINDVLDIARIEAGHLSLSPEPVSVSGTIRMALDLVRPLTVANGIQLSNVEIPGATGGFVLADPKRLSQVLVNLLANAIKFNIQGGRVIVSATSIAGDPTQLGEYESTGFIRISVQDTGPGIAPENFTKLFIAFERLGAERTGIEGTGLGLSLCKHLVEAMHGQIGVASSSGAGSTFWVELPRVDTGEDHASAGETPSQPDASTTSTEPLTILYIEDNSSNFALIQRALAMRGEQVTLLPAQQGSLGLELARGQQPHLILLDLHLPDIMGDEVLARLKAEPSTRDIPVIMLSADASPGQITRLLAAGAEAYLTKPLNLKTFFSVIDKTLDRDAP